MSRAPAAAAPPAVTGRWLDPGDPGFDEAVLDRVFNHRRPDRRPVAVLVAADVADVATGVRWARAHGHQVAVRSGGHSWAVWSVREGSVLIDLGALRSLDYDPATEIVVAGPAVQGGTELRPFLAERGRFFPSGHCPTVGIGGFLLQGGQGWDARGLGWAAEYVEAVDVVTADGELVRADAHRHTDLYWAARGAGPGFPGVVVAFHLRTLPVPNAVVEHLELYPLEHYAAVMTWLQEIHGSVAPEVEIVAIAMTPPGGQGHVLAVTGTALVGDRAAGEAALAPLTTCPVAEHALLRVLDDHADLTPLLERQVAANPERHRYRVDNAWLQGTPTEVVPALRGLFCELPTPKSFAIWFSMAPLRELPDMAFSQQSEIYCAAYVIDDDPALDDGAHAWLTARMAELQPVTAGQYLGDSDLAHRELRVLGDEAWARLTRIRGDRDPDRVFAGYLCRGTDPTNANHWEARP